MSQQSTDKSVYRTTEGIELSTKERVVKDVIYPEPKNPSDEQLWEDRKRGIVNINFLTEFFRKEGRLREDQALEIIERGTAILAAEPNLLHLDAPTTVCGDIHGQFYDLLKLLEVGGDPEKTRYLFMGDYVDRGYFSIECMLLLWSYKIKYPRTFWLLRGNHECRHLTNYFTFKRECEHKYGIDVYDTCTQSFDALPLAAVMNKQFFCVHGGISPQLKSLEDLERLNRFREPPTKGLLCDLLWADPHEDFGEEPDGTGAFVPNNVRGCSYFYTFQAATAFLKRTGLLSIIRAHEAQDAGYRTYRKNESTGFPAVMTIFSAPNYLDAYNNKAAVLKYENNVLNIRQFNSSPHPYWLPNFMDVFTWSLPFVGEKVSEMLMAILNTCTREELDAPPPSGTDSELAKIMASASVPQDGPGSVMRVASHPASLVASASISPRGMANSAESVPVSPVDNRAPMPADTMAKFRNKVLAIGRISRMFSVLREESELISEFKDVSGTQYLPKGTLMLGAQGIRDCIHNFEEARKADLANEGLPPLPEDKGISDIRKMRRQQSLKQYHP